MLRIIILHEAMTMRVHVMQERQQCLLQDLHVELCVHNPVKDADPSGTSHTDASPDVDLHWVLSSVPRKQRKHNKLPLYYTECCRQRASTIEVFYYNVYMCLQVNLQVGTYLMYKAYTCMYMYNSCKRYTYVVNNILHVLYQERIKRYEYQKVQFMRS